MLIVVCRALRVVSWFFCVDVCSSCIVGCSLVEVCCVVCCCLLFVTWRLMLVACCVHLICDACWSELRVR